MILYSLEEGKTRTDVESLKYLNFYLFIQYFQRVALLASIASLPNGPQ